MHYFHNLEVILCCKIQNHCNFPLILQFIAIENIPSYKLDFCLRLQNGARAGWALQTLLQSGAPGLLRERKSSTGHALRRCAAGTDLVEWLMTVGVHSRQQATAMWQVLLEEGVITHGEYIAFICCKLAGIANFIWKLKIACALELNSRKNVSVTP